MTDDLTSNRAAKNACAKEELLVLRLRRVMNCSFLPIKGKPERGIIGFFCPCDLIIVHLR
jgi:hypothetical protein